MPYFFWFAAVVFFRVVCCVDKKCVLVADKYTITSHIEWIIKAMMPTLASVIHTTSTLDNMPQTSPKVDSISIVPGLDDNSSLASMGGDIFDLKSQSAKNNLYSH